MLQLISKFPNGVDAVCNWIAQILHSPLETKFGKLFLALVMIGPVTFIPTIIQAWTAENIDALRTSTWWMMTLINTSAFISLCRKGSWYMRLNQLVWIVACALVWIPTMIR